MYVYLQYVLSNKFPNISNLGAYGIHYKMEKIDLNLITIQSTSQFNNEKLLDRLITGL